MIPEKPLVFAIDCIVDTDLPLMTMSAAMPYICWELEAPPTAALWLMERKPELMVIPTLPAF